eukprot:CAMPEP_0178407124 /NCGR_PEP_ID=MMETSP0689_2-20121128/19266_1 /TAXON_ID=160604 /ORGANISM="Amphidinium massartii, Strain CS-259" /LENGTH=560 /DNA_ID=CAMNT_0020028187 /DNA_START=34 /DNA_END=1715 /DNA_ORIENTATION=+
MASAGVESRQRLEELLEVALDIEDTEKANELRLQLQELDAQESQLVASSQRQCRRSRSRSPRRAEDTTQASLQLSSLSAQQLRDVLENVGITELPHSMSKADLVKKAKSLPSSQAAAVEEAVLKLVKRRCARGHELKVFELDVAQWPCQLCHRYFTKGSFMYGCSACNYDECEACYEAAEAAAQPDPVIVEYNKVIKKHLQRGDTYSAWKVLAENTNLAIRVTFNEFLNYSAAKKDLDSAFQVIARMQWQGLKPSKVSASIILKALNPQTEQRHVKQAIDLLRWVSSTEGVDDVLISTLAETVVRAQRPELNVALVHILDDFSSMTWSVQTCGSLIRAHGLSKDLKSVWKRWKSIRLNGLKPTAVTTGCMVEQLVMNNQVDQALNLVDELVNDDGFGDCVNAVVYGSLFKGLTRVKAKDKVEALRSQMQRRGIEPKIETWNAMIGAYSVCGMVDSIPELMQEMRDAGVMPNVRTFTRLAKGHCVKAALSKAADVEEEMRQNGIEPDEIFFNTLLDGHAEHGDEAGGRALLERMKKLGLGRSKYTNTIVQKLDALGNGGSM